MAGKLGGVASAPARPVSGRLMTGHFSCSQDACSHRTDIRQRMTRGVVHLLASTLLSTNVPHPRLPARFHRVMRLNYKANDCSHVLLGALRPRALLLGSLYQSVRRYIERLYAAHAPHIDFLPNSTRTLSFPERASLVASYSALR